MTGRTSLFHWLRSLARNIFRRRTSDADLGADVQSYVDLLIDEKIANGMRPELARRAARLEFGGVEAVKEEARAVEPGPCSPSCGRTQATRCAWPAAIRDLPPSRS